MPDLHGRARDRAAGVGGVLHRDAQRQRDAALALGDVLAHQGAVEVVRPSVTLDISTHWPLLVEVAEAVASASVAVVVSSANADW